MTWLRTLLLATALTLTASAQSIAPGSSGSLSPDCYVSTVTPISATGIYSQFNNVKSACTTWILFYQTSSNVNSLSIQIESASAGSGSMQAGTFAVLGEASTTSGSGQITSLGNPGWVQVNLSTFGTSSGTGVISWVLAGWRSTGPLNTTGTGSGTAGGAGYQLTTCDSVAVVNVTAAATTQLVALVAARSIRVCALVITASATGTAQFKNGTGSNCGTGTASLTGAMAVLINGAIALGSGSGELFKTPVSNALCLAAVTGNITGFVSYAVY